MAAAGHGESTSWPLEGWNPGLEQSLPQMQNGYYSAVPWGPPSTPREPHLPYPPMASIWPPQSQPEAVPVRVREIEGLLSHPARPQPSPRPPRPRPQSVHAPYSPSPRSPLSTAHSVPSMIFPPPSADSTSFTARPSISAMSTSWAQYPPTSVTEQPAPPAAYATSREPTVQHLQAPSQQGYFMHYPDSNRTFDFRNRPPAYLFAYLFLTPILRVLSPTTYGVHRGTHVPSVDIRPRLDARGLQSPSEPAVGELIPIPNVFLVLYFCYATIERCPVPAQFVCRLRG
jgi:hypothetical protein